jgi:hypothetical protein
METTTMMDPFRLTQTLHARLVDDVAEMQRQIVLQTLIAQTFEHPLPLSKLLRGNPRALSQGKETCESMVKRWQNSIREKTETILELEAMLDAHDEGQMKALAERIKSVKETK